MYQATEAVITSCCNLHMIFDNDAPPIVDVRMFRNVVLKFQVVEFFFYRIEAVIFQFNR